MSKQYNKQELVARRSKYWDEVIMIKAYRATHTKGFPTIDRFSLV